MGGREAKRPKKKGEEAWGKKLSSVYPDDFPRFWGCKSDLIRLEMASVHSLGSVGRQVARGSRSHEILTTSAKQLAQTEPAMENSFNNLQRMQVLLAQMAHSQANVEDNLKRVEGVGEQIRDMQR